MGNKQVWIAIGLPLDCHWIAIALPLDYHWITIGLPLDCYWIAIGLLWITIGLPNMYAFRCMNQCHNQKHTNPVLPVLTEVADMSERILLID